MGFSMNKPNMNISYGGESNKQQKSNLMKDNPVAKHASAANMYGKHDSPASLIDPKKVKKKGKMKATMTKKMTKIPKKEA